MGGVGSKARVLIVGDDSREAENLRDLFANAGLDVAIIHYRRPIGDFLDNPQALDLVVADLDSHENNGFDLLELVRKERPDLPVIILAGNASFESGIRAIEGGAFDYIVKPFDMERLLWAVRQGLSKDRAGLK